MFLGGSDSTEVTPVTELKSLLNISSRSATPNRSKSTPRSGRRSVPEQGSKTTPSSGRKVMRLVDVSGDDDDDDGIGVTKFGRLNVGFTPGMDGKSRRVSLSCFVYSYEENSSWSDCEDC